MRFSPQKKIDGELACRRLSEKAKKFYDGTDPLDVFEYQDDNGDKRYAIRGIIDAFNLSFEELDKMFSDLCDQSGNED